MILLLFLFGLALGAESPSDDNEVKLQLDNPAVKLLRGTCPMFWYSFNDRCYKYVATHLTWADAELYCVSVGANLVSVHSQEEENFIRLLIRNFDYTEGPTWNGLSDVHKEGRWMWSDGSVVDFTYWMVGEPDNSEETEHCVGNNYNTAKKWNDFVCSLSLPSVCALRKVCN